MNKQDRQRIYELAESVLSWDKKNILRLSKDLEELESLCVQHGLEVSGYLKPGIPTAPYPKQVSTVGLVARDVKGMYLIRSEVGLEVVREKDLDFTESARLKAQMKKAPNIKDRGSQLSLWVEEEVAIALSKYMAAKHIMSKSDVIRRAVIEYMIAEGFMSKP